MRVDLCGNIADDPPSQPRPAPAHPLSPQPSSAARPRRSSEGVKDQQAKRCDDVIPERAGVILYLGAGNRDERAFKDPNTFDIHRDDLHMGKENRSGRYKDGKNGHLGFGIGQHFCMGYAMARQESAIACSKLAGRIKNARPKYVEHEGISSPSIDSGGFRTPAELWMKFDT